MTIGRAVQASAYGGRNGLLDALRGLAVAAVVAYHVWPDAVPGGFLGVDVFFVLSGFLISTALVGQLQAREPKVLARFWVRRARRLLPALSVVLVVATAAAGLLGGSPAARLRAQLIGALTFTSNWYQAGSGQSYFDRYEPPLFQHLWSLAVEEQLYLVWPLFLLLLIRFVPRERNRAAAVAAVAAASALAMAILYVPGHDPSRLYFGTDTHGFSAVIGALGACAARVLPRALGGARSVWVATSSLLAAIAALGVLLVAFVRMGDTGATAYRGGILAVDLCTALMILVFCELDHARISRALPVRPLLWLGTRSYGLYLWHWPVVVLTARVWETHNETEGIVRGIVEIVVSLVLAAGSWTLVERPVLRGTWRHDLRRHAVVSGRVRRRAAVVLTAVAMTFGLSAHALATSPAKTSAQQNIEAGLEALQQAQPQSGPTDRKGAGAEGKGDDADNPDRPTAPVAAKPPAVRGRTITVLGDSVTVASAPALLARFPGVEIDAQVGAQLWDAEREIAKLRVQGLLRPYVVVALGTNGDVASSVLPSLLRAAGPGHWFVFVTPHGDRSWIPPVAQKIRAFATHAKDVALADWDAASSQVRDFADDGIHPGPQGGGVFAATVAGALQKLHADA